MNLFINTFYVNKDIVIELKFPIDKEAYEDVKRVIKEISCDYSDVVINEVQKGIFLIECKNKYTTDRIFERVTEIADLYKNKFRYKWQNLVMNAVSVILANAGLAAFDREFTMEQLVLVYIAYNIADVIFTYMIRNHNAGEDDIKPKTKKGR